ncbi:MAG: type II secretion system protein GspD [Planctomycetota bacterium]
MRAVLLGLLALLGPTVLPVATARVEAQVPRITFVELFHVDAEDVVQFLRDTSSLKAFVDDGTVSRVAGKDRSLTITADEGVTNSLLKIIRDYENLEVRDRVVNRTITIKYASVGMVLEALAAGHVCQVWHRTEETKNDQTKQGNRTVTHTYKRNVYSRYEPAKGEVLPGVDLPAVPYVLEIPHVEPVEIPPVNMGQGYQGEEFTLQFDHSPSTETRNRILVVGTEENIERIQNYIDQIDTPARQVMIEVQIIELAADSLTDLGIDVLALQKRRNVVNFASPLPGEAIQQPGDGFSPIDQAGLSFLFDDTAERLSGQFLAGVHALVRKGDAVIRARPKLYTLDDRQNILHLGEEIPTFVSTAVTREATGGNFVENVNQVATRYIGITLNVKPRISGPEQNDVSMLVDIQVNNLQGRARVFEEDLLGIPEVSVRKFRGQARVRNHRPLILGGLIRESEFESKNKIPLVGDVPFLGDFLGRSNKQRQRTEIIIVMTPHILSETGVDPIATPKESAHFDTFNSVLFNDRYILKGRDLVGLDPISRTPVDTFTEEQVFDLTLMNIVKRRELIRKLRILDDYLPEAAQTLSSYKRAYPEKSVRGWDESERDVFYRAAAILVENIKSLNPGLTYEDLVSPRREIILPTSPYHVSLSFDKLRTFYDKGEVVLLRGEDRPLSSETIAALRSLSSRTLREFSSFMELAGRAPEDHGRLREELTRYYRSLYPDGPAVDGLDYPEFFLALSEVGIDFLSIATYLSSRLETQFRDDPISLGGFEEDLASFRDRSVTLDELGERLESLDDRWERLSTSDRRPVTGL